jgi:hypothetical protein
MSIEGIFFMPFLLEAGIADFLVMLLPPYAVTWCQGSALARKPRGSASTVAARRQSLLLHSQAEPGNEMERDRLLPRAKALPWHVSREALPGNEMEPGRTR